MASSSIVHAAGTEAERNLKEKIEKNVAHHSQVVFDYRRQLNALALINRLPIELLVEIFYFWRDSWRFSSPYTSSSCTILTGVCHHWRDLVVGTPGLWDVIEIDHCVSTSMLRHLLHRAKDVPLHLEARSHMEDGQIALFNEEIVPNIHRVSSINLLLPVGDDPQPLTTLFTGMLPTTSQLRSFDLTSDRYPYTFPNIFKRCKFPNIQRLKLDGHIRNLPPSLLSPTIVELELCLTSTSEESVDPVKFIQSLSYMSLLRLLTIRNVPFWPDHRLPLPSQKISLPRLRNLGLCIPRGSEEAYTCLTSNLQLSGLEQAHIDFQELMPDHVQFPKLIDATLNLLRPRKFGLFWIDQGGGSLTMALWATNIYQAANSQWAPEPSFVVLFPVGYKQALWEEFIPNINSHHIEAADLHVGSRYWRGVVTTWRNLKQVDVTKRSNALEMLKLLLEKEEVQAGQGTPVLQFILPKLETLRLSDVIWGSQAEMESGGRNEFVETVINVVKKRNIVGHPLQRVIIASGLNVCAEYVDLIREAGVDVEWYGAGGHRSAMS